MSFSLDKTALRINALYDIPGDPKTMQDLETVLKDALPIVDTEQDNDSERWFLTRAGQFIRQCGMRFERSYVFPADDARGLLEHWAPDETIALLFDLGVWSDSPGSKP